ncbi:YdcF family protein [Allochromatium palmeri]|uniref:DUF218 domain-containing protein n=1 Tax=Allochromatium palmeri TaxID=231048 RepID=A0A6N8EEV9_9GAMM|nr:YdcF family protein [Allochromatium palmeri]MTW22775.1 hypothetical protein [Allochromatium palmeri]
MFLLNQELVASYLFMDDRELEADFTFVLGMSLWHRPLARAMDLYRQGIAGRLLFSGGYNPRISQCEAVEMYRLARASGVPDSDILLDTEASNTAENFLYASRLLQDRGIATEAITINIVAIHFHMRRAWLTAERVFGAGIRIGLAAYPSVHYSSADWHTSVRGRQDVAAEISKIERYFPGSLPSGLQQTRVVGK